MRKILFIFLIAPIIVCAAPVSKERAYAIGENFFNKSIEAHRVAGKQAHFIVQQPDMKKVCQHNGNTYAPYYIFNNEDGGFVIVAGDDCATPILGYSTEGSIDPNNLPIQLEELLNAYAEEIQLAVKDNDKATNGIEELWNNYYRAPQSLNATAVVNALITTTWNQYPRYNDKCPVDASLANCGGHPTTGCVATAMGQIMKYWEYPQKGYGNKSYRSDHYGTLSANFAITEYDWANMPLKLSSSSTSTQIDAVATLLYHCGVAVEMKYNSDGSGSSGANTIDWGCGRASAETALKTYFGYSSTLKGKQSSSMSASEWKSLLKSELDNSRPMLYRGVSSQGGHCFICDGYDTNDYFHFNWGWGGQSNGFYSLTAGTSRSHNFSQDQCAVIGIKPKDGSGPARTYDLYMNASIEATNATSSSSETNPFTFGKNISFRAKIKNKGTGVFNGYLKVAIYDANGEFIAWSKESPRFSLGAGDNTDWQAFTFDGGMPFIPGKYRAYVHFQDDNEDIGIGLVKTNDGILFDDKNNILFNIVSPGDLKPMSAFKYDEIFGNFITGSKVRIDVDIRNTAVFTAFYGKIRLCLFDAKGNLAEVIEELDYSNGFPSSTTYNLSFTNIIESEPGSYYLTLTYQKSGETIWNYMGCISSYPNPILVNVTAPQVYADDYESNNTHSTAKLLNWEIDEEIDDFSTLRVSLHQDSDIDFYKLAFPEPNQYKIAVSIYDKYHPGSQWYVNADTQFAYAIEGNSYSANYQGNQMITFNGPATVYIRVKQYGLSGLGFYGLSGDIEETILDAIDDVDVDQPVSKILRDGQILILRGDKTYTITGTEINKLNNELEH